ncbi:unnamed protein product, partial [Polarella glacialis]
AYLQHVEDCPLGVLNAELLLYTVAQLQGDSESAAFYAERAIRGIRSLPLHIIAGSRWPLLALLTSEQLRKQLTPSGRDVANDTIMNCENLEEPLLNWRRYQSLFWGDDRKDWYENSIRYVFSWQMREIPQALASECPLGYLLTTLIKAFTCATSESSCYADNAKQVEAWLAETPDAFDILAHSRWPLAVILNHMARGSRHRYHLDFTEAELSGKLPRSSTELLSRLGSSGEDGGDITSTLSQLGPWAGSLASQHTQSFRDLVSLLPRLGAGHPEAPSLIYMTMIYGAKFNRHMKRFCSRARALGVPGERLILFTLDDEAFKLCLTENDQRCVRGTQSIVNKFTLPLLCARLGLDVVWIDLDVFLMADPTPAIVGHANRGPYDILISGSFESDCICNGIVYFRATDAVRDWLLAVVVWMYNHPYEHDQKTFSAFLDYTETVSSRPLDLPTIPAWDTLDPINQFVTPDTFEGNGWSGDVDRILIYHFLNGESDKGSSLDASGTWTREHGHYTEEGGASPGDCKADMANCKDGRVSLMDLFYGQEDEDLYRTPKPAHENLAIRRALLAARKDVRRTDLLGKPCGPMVGVVGDSAGRPPPRAASLEELLEAARKGTAKALGL